MKQSIDFNDFVKAFEYAGRENQFSRAGLEMLFDYLEQYEQDTGEELELDVIALCCDYAEATAEEIASDYEIEIDLEDEEPLFSQVLQYLNFNTVVCDYDEDANIIVFNQFKMKVTTH